MKKMLQILNQPYPYYNANEKIPKTAFIILLFAFLFLYLVRPFTINQTELKFSYPVICLLHALNAATIYMLFFFLFNSFTNILAKEENWKVYSTILLTAIVLFLIGLGSFLIRPVIYNNPDNFSWHYFTTETVNTFLVGSVIFSGFTMFDYSRLLKINQANASGLEHQLEQNKLPEEEKVTEKDNLQITILVEDEPFELNPDEFLFAKAEGNYVTFYFTKNAGIIKYQKRASLKNIEAQLNSNSATLIKTHRAFLVNTKHIKKMTGNAQGYQLFFELIDFPIPVSRALIPAFKLALKAQ